MTQFFLSSVNPNDAIGGGGCVCSERKHEDCTGPYVICPGTEMSTNDSPYTVISLRCAQAWLDEAERKGEDILAAGEADTQPLVGV